MKQQAWDLIKAYWMQLNTIDVVIGGVIGFYAKDAINFFSAFLPAAS